MGEPPIALNLTREELEKTLGVFFLGYVVSSVIYGFNFFQVWRYSSQSPSDPAALKVFVAIVCLLDLGSMVLVSHGLYIYLIIHFPRTIGLVTIITTLGAEMIVAVLSIFLVQSYYAYRLWAAHKKTSVAMVMEIIALGACVLGMVRTIDSSHNYEFRVLGLLPVRLQITFRHALVLLGGLILAIMQWRLPTSNPGHLDLFDKVVLNAITRFGLANLVQLAYLICFATSPTAAFWIPFHLCAQKLYVNAFLNGLNDRPTWSHGGSSNGTGPQSFVNPESRSGDNDNEEQGNKPTHPRTEEISQQLTVLSNDISNYSWDPHV